MVKNIKILGTGCAKCQTLYKVVQEVVNENQIEAQVEKIEDMMQIMEYNVMATPALVVEKKVVSKGRIPSKKELLELIAG